MTAVGLFGGVEPRVVLGEDDVVPAGRVFDPDRPGSGAGGFERVGDDERDGPAAVRDTVVLEDREDRVVGLLQARRVVVGEDGMDARDGERLGRADRGDPPAGDRGGHGPCPQTAGRGVFRGVACGTGDLVTALAADDGRARGLGAWLMRESSVPQVRGCRAKPPGR